jgi:hypothetical protein
MHTTQAETDEEIETEIDESDVPNGAEGDGNGEEPTPEPAPIVSFDEDSPPQPSANDKDNETIREMRRTIREQGRKLRELEKSSAPTSEAPTLGPKPTLDDPDVEFDEEKYAAKMERWIEQRRQRDTLEQQRKAEALNAEKSWKEKLETYGKERASIKGEDFEESEFAVQKTLNQDQQSIIIHAVSNPARMVLALGKSPKKLAELASITDPVRFAVEIGKLESKMGATASTRTPPPPERMVSGSTATRATSDAKLEKLREEAARTGNFTKVNDYKRSLKK